MTKEEQIKIFNDNVEKMRRTLLSKGDDYANEDRLSNFKLVAEICRLTPQQVCLVFMATKIVRLGNLASSASEPNHESVKDNTIDSSNYNMLYDMLNEEAKSQIAEPKPVKFREGMNTDTDINTNVNSAPDAVTEPTEFIKCRMVKTKGYRINPDFSIEDLIEEDTVDEHSNLDTSELRTGINLRVIGNTSNHKFDIGSVVELTYWAPTVCQCEQNGIRYWVHNTDLVHT